MFKALPYGCPHIAWTWKAASAKQEDPAAVIVELDKGRTSVDVAEETGKNVEALVAADQQYATWIRPAGKALPAEALDTALAKVDPGVRDEIMAALQPYVGDLAAAGSTNANADAFTKAGYAFVGEPHLCQEADGQELWAVALEPIGG